MTLANHQKEQKGKDFGFISLCVCVCVEVNIINMRNDGNQHKRMND